MNKLQIQILLYQWMGVTSKGKIASQKKAEKSIGGLCGRIKRTVGQPVIFDIETYDRQKSIQDMLCKELPQWADLIRSQPAIMDGYSWTRNDFIDLYFEHFDLIIEKLQRIIEKKEKQK